MNMKDNEFRCEICKRVFQRREGWNEELKYKEMIENVGDIPEEDRMLTCTECYNLLLFIQNL